MTLSAVDARPICVNCRVALRHWSLATVQSSRARSELVSGSRLLKAARTDAGRLVAHAALGHELANVLARGRASQKRLGQELWNLAIGHERMHANLVQRWSRCRVARQNSRNQIPGLIRYWNVIWERILVSLDSRVRGFDVSGLERRLTYNERVEDDAEGPDVYFVRVACSALQHFRCNVVWSTANSPLLLAIEIEFGSQTEVSQFDLHLVI